MKLKYNTMLLVSVFFIFLMLAGMAFAREAEATVEKPGVGMQFVNSFTCVFTQCGWPAIIILILPAIAVYVWKKVFSWG